MVRWLCASTGDGWVSVSVLQALAVLALQQPSQLNGAKRFSWRTRAHSAAPLHTASRLQQQYGQEF
ncbi:hypothetical protein FOMPIDRAFT_1025534 [Fomitopsis schrenkii]|uniref:Secreted protein n=1 Tax=Fomitopsis schrenkii TaxID=2126942 RepID=S8DTV7_FOMSC|nr:hypothetical protein FOMPIDRAFT_1025534 [Fomitopsis schrenkii]